MSSHAKSRRSWHLHRNLRAHSEGRDRFCAPQNRRLAGVHRLPHLLEPSEGREELGAEQNLPVRCAQVNFELTNGLKWASASRRCRCGVEDEVPAVDGACREVGRSRCKHNLAIACLLLFPSHSLPPIPTSSVPPSLPPSIRPFVTQSNPPEAPRPYSITSTKPHFLLPSSDQRC